MIDESALAQDERARRHALDTTRSVLLQAPAGSGKTTVLTARYLALLAAVDAPEEILAMTFTRKAAAEMRHRVLAALQAASSGQEVTGISSALLRAAGQRDAERGWQLLRNPSRLRIDTIDALNYWLASQLPIAARASPGLRIAAHPDVLYRRAARRCLQLAASEPAIARATDLVFERLDNRWDGVEKRLSEMLRQRSHWLQRVVGASGEQLVERTEQGLASALRSELAAAMSGIVPELLRESEAMLSHSLRERGMPVPAHGVQLSGDPGCIAHWRQLAELLLSGKRWRKRFTVTEGFGPTDKIMKARLEDLRDALASSAHALQRLCSLRELPDPDLKPVDREALTALALLLVRAATELQLEFAASGSVDFSYVSAAAREALTEQSDPSDLALRTGAALRHVLMDEFQDTSFEQLALLLALTASWEPGDGRTVFVVGDPMQSIYQFRAAEVGLFLRARDHGIGEIRLEGLQLRQNFRSRAPVIEWVNRQFAQLFPADDDARLAAVRYLPSTPGPKEIRFDGAAVTLHAFTDGDVSGEADSVLQIVRSARAREPQCSIAVLVAARQHAAPLVAKLCAAEIAVRGIDLEPLNERAVVRDLAALTRSLLHGADRSAWLALLRSPWCGLTLSEMNELQLTEAGDLFALLSAACAASGNARLRRLCEALEPALLGSERALPLWRRVEHSWLRLGGASVYAREADRLDARRFIDALAEHEDPEQLAGEALSEITKRLYSSSPPQPGTIDVMTMHAAKGLEWDVVILPSLGRKTASTPDRLLHWIELPRGSQGMDMLLAPIRATDKEAPASLAGYIKRLRRERSDLERVRLLYVATTRARKALHLLGGLKSSKTDTQPAPQARSLLHVLWPTIGDEFLASYATAVAAVRTGVGAASKSQSLRRLPAPWRLPQPPPGTAVERLSLASSTPALVPEYSWVGLTARAVGTIVHAELLRLAQTPAATIASDYGVWLSELGVGREDLRPATLRIREALLRTLEDERGRWLLSSAHREAHSEWRLTGMHEGRVVNVIFDRMLVDEYGQRWVVDYKTSTHEGGEIEEFIEREAERYLAQMRRYAALASQLGAAPVRIALYFPLLGVFRELAS